MSTPRRRRFYFHILILVITVALALPPSALAAPTPRVSLDRVDVLGAWSDFLAAWRATFLGGETKGVERAVGASTATPPNAAPPGVLRDEGAEIDPLGRP